MLAALGLGCYLGWQTIGISPTLFPEPRPGVDEAVNAWGYVATVLLLALLALFAALSRKRGPLLRARWPLALAALGPAAGTALMHLGGWAAEPACLPAVALGRVLFAASAGFVVLWGEVLSRLAPSRTLACVSGGYALSFGICLVEAGLSATGALVLRPVLPLLSGAMLLALREDALPALGPAAPEEAPLARQPVRLFVGTGILGAVFTATNHLSETKTPVSTELYTLYAGVAVSLAVLAVALATRGRGRDFARAYRLVTPLVIGCLLLTLVLEPGSQRYEALAIGGAWTFFRVFTWTLWARVGSRDPGRGAYVFALGQIALTTCSTVCELVCTAVDLATVPFVWAAAAIIFVAVATSALVMDEGWPWGPREAGDVVLEEPEPERRQAQAPGDGGGAPLGGGQGEAGLRSATPAQLEEAARGFGLSERESEISLLVVQGLDNAAICEKACITESTLRTHLRNIYAKLGVHSRAELVALVEGLLQGR